MVQLRTVLCAVSQTPIYAAHFILTSIPSRITRTLAAVVLLQSMQRGGVRGYQCSKPFVLGSRGEVDGTAPIT